MNSFSTGKLKEITSLMQLIVKALIGIDEETGELNEKQLYGILQSISSEDEERKENIDGTLQEQIKALNASINSLNTTLGNINTNINRTNDYLDYIDNTISSTNDTPYVRVMLPDGIVWVP